MGWNISQEFELISCKNSNMREERIKKWWKKNEKENEGTFLRLQKKGGHGWIKELRINVNLNHGKDIAIFLILRKKRDIELNCRLVYSNFWQILHQIKQGSRRGIARNWQLLFVTFIFICNSFPFEI